MAHAFPKSHRLLNKDDYDRVFSARRSRADGLMVVYTLANGGDHPRLGLVVSRKVGNAVARNRWKRLLREAFRLSQHDLPAVDVVCLPRAKATPTLEGVRRSLIQLTRPRSRKH